MEPVEGGGDGRAPVDDDRVAAVVGDVAAPDVERLGAVVGDGVDAPEEERGPRVVLQGRDAAGEDAAEARWSTRRSPWRVEPVGGLRASAQLVAGVVEVGLLAGEDVGGRGVVGRRGHGGSTSRVVVGSILANRGWYTREGHSETGRRGRGLSVARPADCRDGPIDSSHPSGVRRRRPGDPQCVLGVRARRRGYAVPAPPGDFADWPAFLTANGVPEERWNDASAIEAEGHPRIFFQKVPEPKAGKNRVHVDLLAGGGPSVPLDEQRRAGRGRGGAARGPRGDPRRGPRRPRRALGRDARPRGQRVLRLR